MNKYIKTIAVLSVLTLTTSCNLDPEITEYIPQGRHDELVADSDVVNNVAKAALSKTYAIFQEFYRSHDDFGLKAFHIATDLMCEDVAYRNWNSIIVKRITAVRIAHGNSSIKSFQM